MDATALARMELPLAAAGVSLTECGAEFGDNLSFAQWLDIGAMLRRAERSCQWWIGDWLRYGGHKWGDKYKEAAESLGLSPRTLSTYKQVADAYPEFTIRIVNCPFTHHQIAASLPATKRQRLLEKAAAEGWSRSRLVQEIAQTTPRIAPEPSGDDAATVESLLDLVGQKFATIYADPPWKYGNQATRASTDDHYGTMTVDDLCLMPVADLAADDAHLHLWTTNGFLPDAFRVISAWGFKYRSCFVWVKPQMGIGNYWRVSHEFLLLGIRGDAKRFNYRKLKSWGEFKRRRHSAKPEEVREMIELASPGPYLEMFGRNPAPGWTVMGNQIERKLFP